MSVPFRRACLAVACVAAIAVGVGTAAAAEPAPDKSGYTLLDPTPPELLRNFTTDRPTRANVPFTIDAGQYQVETDLLSHSHDRNDRTRTTQSGWSVLNPIFKIGLTNDVQLDLVHSGFYTRTETRNPATGGTTGTEGTGDVSLRTKVNLWGNEGGDTAFALMPYVKVPTSTGGIGNNHVETGILTPLAVSLPYEFTMIVMPSVDILAAPQGGTYAHFGQVLNVNREVLSGVTAFVEFYADERRLRGAPNFYTLDFGLAWVIAPDFQVDFGSYVGLNRAAPDLQTYVGFSHRF